MYLKRNIEPLVTKALKDGFVTIIYGARQVGKTTLVKRIISDQKNSLYLNCDDPAVVLRLQNQSMTSISTLIGFADSIVIDEAQRIQNIGITAKLIHDNLPEKKLLFTGSSSLDLANKIKEPLTGRSREFLLYPFSVSEVAVNQIEADGLLQRLLIHGGYPGAWFMSELNSEQNAREIANRYLYRDAFALGTIYDQTIIDNLLRLLAQQISSEVSYNELANRLEINKETVKRYIDLLEKAFIVFRLPQFRRSQRTQLGRLRKIYFYDLGIRNALVGDFRPLKLRSDIGALWENFIVVERQKRYQLTNKFTKTYYWRSRDTQEVDLIEEFDGKFKAFEAKWSKEARIPGGFRAAYPEIIAKTITKDNYWEYLN